MKNFKVMFESSLNLVQIFIPLAFLPILVHSNTTLKEFPIKVIGDKLRDEYIIPDVIYNTPVHGMKVRFSEDNEFNYVNYGNWLTPRQARHEPAVEWPVEKDQIYTLLSVSPDVPNREEPSLRDWVHWLVPNIHGCNVSSGDNINHWQGPGPGKTSGEHRYVFIVFKQSPDFPIHLNRSDESEEMRTFTKRMEFNTDNFIRHFNLGEPWAANFFMSKFNDFK